MTTDARVEACLREAVRDEVAPTIVVGCVDFRLRHGNRHVWTAGESRGKATQRQAVFDLASLTKPLATALLAAVFVDRGFVKAQTPVVALLPQLGVQYQEVTIEHLLAHQAGLPAWKPFFETTQNPEAFWKELFLTPLERPVGESSVYSDLSFMILGRALEVVGGGPLDALVREHVYQSWGVRDLCFDRQFRKAVGTRVVPTENGLLGIVHDDNARRLGEMGGGVLGHAGLFGTADAVLDTVECLMSHRLSASVLNWMWTPVKNSARTPGWDTPTGDRPSSGSLFSKRTVGHLGYTGTSLWIDLDRLAAVVVLTNRVAFGRENKKIQDFRPTLHDRVMEFLS